MPRPLFVVMIVVAAFCGAQSGAPVTPKATLDIPWNRFRDWTETESALKAIRGAWPSLVTLESIGESVEGRTLWLATLADRDGVPLNERPGMWIDANVHGNEVQGTEACLYTLWWLCEERARNPRVAALLKRVVFYILPSQNPDGRDWWFKGPNTTHSSRTGKKPLDEDRDGRFDEDGPDDLDGDGSITQMWKRVPKDGTHIEDPDDPRILRAVRPGQSGTWVYLGQEGIDNDGDGEVNEDGPGGYDMNRNWPSDWQPNWIQGGAGDYPLSFPETRAIADAILARPNIAGVQSYHNNGGMILRGPGSKDFGDYPSRDLEVYDALGKAGEEMLPFYKYMIIWKDLYSVHGGFVNWTYEGLGIVSFTNELWNPGQYTGRMSERGIPGSRMSEKERLEWDDRLELGARFAPRKEIDHPKWGKIEVGGWKKDTDRVPPPFMLEELCHRNMAFTLYQAESLPEVRFGDVTTTSAGEGLWRVRVELRNDRLTPSRTARARDKRIGRPDVVECTVDGGRIVAGGVVVGAFNRESVEWVEDRPQRIVLSGGVPGRSRVRMEWLIASPKEPQVRWRYTSEKAGTLER